MKHVGRGVVPITVVATQTFIWGNSRFVQLCGTTWFGPVALTLSAWQGRAILRKYVGDYFDLSTFDKGWLDGKTVNITLTYNGDTGWYDYPAVSK